MFLKLDGLAARQDGRALLFDRRAETGFRFQGCQVPVTGNWTIVYQAVSEFDEDAGLLRAQPDMK
jgi:hypothetical protein